MTVFVCGLYAISIHTPLAGSDVRTQVQSQHQKYFNPHSPCGERLEYQRKDMIHVYFNPHSPCGERHAARDSRFEQVISIHTPLAGSDAHEVTYLVVVVISIHTPLAGSDAPDCNRSGTESYFNPHSPCGERLAHAELHNRLVISIHTPLAGSDPHRAQRVAADPISIHTPLAGSDRRAETRWCHTGTFQSTLPLRGATATDFGQGKRTLDFNPHSPCGERLFVGGMDAKHDTISIHTPLAGSDPDSHTVTEAGSIFQSTLPLRGATEVPAVCGVGDFISIHTPLAGSDRKLYCYPYCVIISIHTPLAGSDRRNETFLTK